MRPKRLWPRVDAHTGGTYRVQEGATFIDVAKRVNPRAKKLILRVDPKTGAPTVTVPVGTSNKQAAGFVAANRDWLLAELERHKGLTIGDGDILLLRGLPTRLQYRDCDTRRVTHTDGILVIGGPASHAGSRLERWMRQEAKNDIIRACEKHAAHIGATYSRISIGDMKTRWGSCSSKGTLKFSWRLIMLPPEILDYVAAHEVCHLKEMNHSPAFWAWVNQCVPGYRQLRRQLHEKGPDILATRLANGGR